MENIILKDIMACIPFFIACMGLVLGVVIVTDDDAFDSKATVLYGAMCAALSGLVIIGYLYATVLPIRSIFDKFRWLALP